MLACRIQGDPGVPWPGQRGKPCKYLRLTRSILIHRFSWCYNDGFWWSKKCKICNLSQNHPTMMGQKSQKIQHFGSKFSTKKIKNTILWSPWKNQNRTQNPPTCQKHHTMMAKNLRFSKKYSKLTYTEGQKSAKLVILSQNSPYNDGKKTRKIQNSGSNWGKNLRKSNILG